MIFDLYRWKRHTGRRFLTSLIGAVALCIIGTRVEAQVFNSGSDGSDGVYAPAGPPGTVVVFDPSQLHGSQASANIFNFTTITIPLGVTVKLSGSVVNAPVVWLAQGNVDINGIVDLNGDAGPLATVNPFARVSSAPGSGGFAGGVAGNAAQAALPGNGPGGGAAGFSANPFGRGGQFSGNTFLIPLIGGSGGGGAWSGGAAFPNGGGAGGGALLIASSTQISVNGTVRANGGLGDNSTCANPSGGGSGGAIRLVANTITGSGTLSVNGGSSCGAAAGGSGRIRLETYSGSFGGGVQGQSSISAPFPLLLPTVGPATAKVISIGGNPINANPSTFPDITINTTSPVNVVIQTQNIPITATIKLTILDENGVADTVIQAPPLGNCDQNSICTTTVPVVFPFGASRGLTRVTWVQ